jgi:hypothetical protein
LEPNDRTGPQVLLESSERALFAVLEPHHVSFGIEMDAGLLTDERQVFPGFAAVVGLDRGTEGPLRFVFLPVQPRISEPSGGCRTDAGTSLAFFSLRSLQTGLGAVNLSKPKRGFR